MGKIAKVESSFLWKSGGRFQTGRQSPPIKTARKSPQTIVKTFYRNNLTNRITVRDGAKGTLSNNLEMTSLSLFVNPTEFDFHLQASATQAIDKGIVVTESGVDIDAEPHTKGAPDIGADER